MADDKSQEKLVDDLQMRPRRLQGWFVLVFTAAFGMWRRKRTEDVACALFIGPVFSGPVDHTYLLSLTNLIKFNKILKFQHFFLANIPARLDKFSHFQKIVSNFPIFINTENTLAIVTEKMGIFCRKKKGHTFLTRCC